MGTAMTLDEITAAVVDAAYALHKGLGPGCWNRSTRGCWRVIFSVGAPTLKLGLQPIVNGLDREAMERRSGRVSAPPREPNRRRPIAALRAIALRSPQGTPSMKMQLPCKLK